MEAWLAAFVALLARLERLLPVFVAFMAGKGAAEYRAMEEQLKQEKAERDLEQELTAFHDSLSDGQLRDVTAKRIERIRLRLKARAAHGSGGHDD